MNVIDGQAGLKLYASLIFYSLTIDNILNIIVLLILAAVSIATLTGENGILTKANNAKTDTTVGGEKEQIKLAYDASMADNYEKGNYTSGVTADQMEEHLNKQNAGATVKKGSNPIEITFESGNTYTVDGKTAKIEEVKPKEDGDDDNTTKREIFTANETIDGKEEGTSDNPIIPKGFRPVDQGDAKWEDDTSVEPAKPSQNSVYSGLVIQDEEGNEFVWVPVKDINDFKTIDGYDIYGSRESYVSNGGLYEPYMPESHVEEANLYNAMKLSVTNNGGFYIGRYETGKDDDESLVIQKNKTAYCIGWNGGGNFENLSGGAVELSKNFAKKDAYKIEEGKYSVTSTLIYGVQWDATMNFFDNNYINGDCEPTSYVVNGGNKDIDCEKNIYDMGRQEEWTMEAGPISDNVGGRMIRLFSSRRTCSVDESYAFRITLYL